jgi:hypothetical protein
LLQTISDFTFVAFRWVAVAVVDYFDFNDVDHDDGRVEHRDRLELKCIQTIYYIYMHSRPKQSDQQTIRPFARL